MGRVVSPTGARPLIIPNVLTPVRADDTRFKGRRNHAAMPEIGPQHMTSAAERPQVAHFVLAAFDVVNVRRSLR